MKNSEVTPNLKMTSQDPIMVKAADALLRQDIGEAEKICRAVLKKDPLNVNAMCMLGDIALRLGVIRDSLNLLERCLELAPDYHLARIHYANALFKKRDYKQSLKQLQSLPEKQANELGPKSLQANVLSQLGRHEEAMEIYQTLTEMDNIPPRIHVSLAHAHKTVGQHDEAVTAYRKAIELDPSLGEAYWSLANLKTAKFNDRELEQMKEQAAAENINRDDFVHLCFALGKALEDRKQYDEAFNHYQRGNQIKKRLVRYDARQNQRDMEKTVEFFTPELMEKFAGHGCPAADPIFIVGLPRAGSTLLEQILASHSLVEGTQELGEIISIVRRLAGPQAAENKSAYPDMLNGLAAADLTELGAEYIERTRVYRTTDAPYFIDKMPNNFAHTGFIKLILPNAKIIDARRNPLDCCVSGFKQLFARGQRFTYDQRDIAQYYVDYVRVMAHWQKVLPGGVLQMIHEDVLTDTEEKINEMLAFCGLPFEAACMKFYQTDRAVRTASSEQVRQPINKKGLDVWRNFADHLTPMQEILGDLVENYR